MKRHLFFSLFLLSSLLLSARDAFQRGLLREETLRIDCTFSGTDKSCCISLDQLCRMEGWAGRRVNMDRIPVRGNGSISLSDKKSGELLYCCSFSTLFQEWQATEEATLVRKSFENVFLLPMPSSEAEVSIRLYDFHNRIADSLVFSVNPSDILIRPVDKRRLPVTKYIGGSGDPRERIDVAIVAEGYTQSQRDLFFRDAEEAVDAILCHEPFKSMRDRFNFLAVALESEDSGVSVPSSGEWKNTALLSQFDTFNMPRYLTTLRLRNLAEKLSGIQYEHIIILANTDTYGGGGIYGSYTLTTAHHPDFRPVVVHEFGHSFGALADEYYYDDQFVEYYYPDVEPWEKNITTLADFDSKWKDMVTPGAPLPTPEDVNVPVGLYEGGGYQSKGVWRGSPDCRMKTNLAEGFCPVCVKALEDMIRFYTDELAD